uniref:Uncharacterized protein n=1 Tax=Arundo donax TaxID=35708 RepID=A0A0A8Z7C4_ARUDO
MMVGKYYCVTIVHHLIIMIALVWRPFQKEAGTAHPADAVFVTLVIMTLIPTNSLRRQCCTVISVNGNIMLVALEIGVISLSADQKDVGFAVGNAQRYLNIYKSSLGNQFQLRLKAYHVLS